MIEGSISQAHHIMKGGKSVGRALVTRLCTCSSANITWLVRIPDHTGII